MVELIHTPIHEFRTFLPGPVGGRSLGYEFGSTSIALCVPSIDKQKRAGLQARTWWVVLSKKLYRNSNLNLKHTVVCLNDSGDVWKLIVLNFLYVCMYVMNWYEGIPTINFQNLVDSFFLVWDNSLFCLNLVSYKIWVICSNLNWLISLTIELLKWSSSLSFFNISFLWP